MKSDLKLTALQLRRQGWMYSEIATELGVSKSTAKLWIASYNLSAKEHALVRQRFVLNRQQNIASMIAAKQTKLTAQNQQLQQDAQRIVSSIKRNRQMSAVLCAVMYWCEGTKQVDKGLTFTNADPVMVRQFLTLLREAFAIDESKFHCLVHLHNYHDIEKQQQFWSEVTNVPRSQFHAPHIKPHIGKNRHPDYPGCLSLRYGDVKLGKLLKMIYSELGQNT